MRISDWSSDVCSSDLRHVAVVLIGAFAALHDHRLEHGRSLILEPRIGPASRGAAGLVDIDTGARADDDTVDRRIIRAAAEQHRVDRRSERAEVRRRGGNRHRRSEEHTSELQSLMRISYAVFCLKKQNTTNHIMMQTTERSP